MIDGRMDVTELAPGLWRWTAHHPDWREDDGWNPEVGCTYYEGPDATVLVDPLVPRERNRFLTALDRDVERRGLPVAILLTVPWHARSADELRERYGTGPAAPAGVEPFGVAGVDDTVYWLPERGALVVGDVMYGAPDGVRVCPDSYLDERSSHDGIRASLRFLLDLPVERILVAHGEPVLAGGRESLERALE
jgi:glyoxylase-like metal-dependent hydrolase (beta-lactamase superfamily II)